MQMSTFVCRQPQDWSGGLTVKCNKAIAIRIDDNNVFTVHNKEGPKINGERCTYSKL
jgi:hypothetical protein